MRIQPWVIEEQRRRESRSRVWEPVPLHIPAPEPRRGDHGEPRPDEEQPATRRVVIIDMNSLEEVDA